MNANFKNLKGIHRYDKLNSAERIWNIFNPTAHQLTADETGELLQLLLGEYQSETNQYTVVVYLDEFREQLMTEYKCRDNVLDVLDSLANKHKFINYQMLNVDGRQLLIVDLSPLFKLIRQHS